MDKIMNFFRMLVAMTSVYFLFVIVFFNNLKIIRAMSVIFVFFIYLLILISEMFWKDK